MHYRYLDNPFLGLIPPQLIIITGFVFPHKWCSVCSLSVLWTELNWTSLCTFLSYSLPIHPSLSLFHSCSLALSSCSRFKPLQHWWDNEVLWTCCQFQGNLCCLLFFMLEASVTCNSTSCTICCARHTEIMRYSTAYLFNILFESSSSCSAVKFVPVVITQSWMKMIGNSWDFWWHCLVIEWRSLIFTGMFVSMWFNYINKKKPL